MRTEWFGNFSYDYFRNILETIKQNFEIHLFSDAHAILNTIGTPKLILRHDVDISLDKALEMAEIENSFSVSASYMIMINSLLYSLEDKASLNIIHQIKKMGHEIGLHYDLNDDIRKENCSIESIVSDIRSACALLEDIIGHPVLSISFHRPPPHLLRGPLVVCDMVNAYSKDLMEYYLSDSKGRWMDGEPLPKLMRPAKLLLQLLIHPIWWGNEHKSPEDRLQEFYDIQTEGRSYQYKQMFDKNLASTLPLVRRKNFYQGLD